MRKKVSLLSGLILTALMLPVMAQTARTPEPPQSGKELGRTLPPFHPRHAAGPDKGTTACPV
ncbi:MAG: hypothetical protein KY468_13610 [Armatimonadetes bacterium]|nr:hypothetical protein [Armatimonadota bacterium]